VDRKRGNKALKRGIVYPLLKVVLGFLLLSFGLACRVPNLDQLNHTRKEPKKSDLLGTWVPDKSSLRVMQSEGGYDVYIQPKLILKADDTFELTNMPDWWDNGLGKSRQGFQDYSGSWGVSTYGDTGFWHLDLKSSSKTRSVNLMGQTVPYRIEFTIGDPDSNVSMIFEKR
jgi:hypothetical protein